MSTSEFTRFQLLRGVVKIDKEMADREPEQEGPIANVAHRSRRRRLEWTNDMNSKLLECKRKAQELAASSDPPRNLSGRKKGYMTIMKELWDESGYVELEVTSQNLRDQASYISNIRKCKSHDQ